MVTSAALREAGSAPAPADERRDNARHLSCCRTVKVTRDDAVSLCRLGNISDDGMMLTCEDPPQAGESLIIELSEDHSVTGRVVWSDDGHCGVQLDRTIDSAEMLRDLAAEQRDAAYRPPRIGVHLLGVAYSELGLHPVRTTDLSQKGMGLSHDGRIRPDLHVLVMLENGVERRGVVRWSHDHRAGLMLTEPLCCADLNRCIGSERGRGEDMVGISRS